MDPDTTGQLIMLVMLLFFSAFFSASETALMSLSKIRIRHMVDEGIKGAPLIQDLVDQPSKMLGAILIGNNIVNIGASALATSLAMDHFGSAGIGIATGLMTLFVLIFGEITPKSLAAQNSEKLSLAVVRIIQFLTVIFSPLLFVLLKFTSLFVRLLGGDGNTERPFITEEELRTMVQVGHEEGVLEGEEKKMIYNVFEFGDAQVREVMTPRMDMIAIDAEATYEDIVEKFKIEQFSRMPVYEENTDNIIGILYLKDLFFYEGAPEDFDVHAFLRKPLFTYEFIGTTELFNQMKRGRVPMAIVLDEYGGTAGIATMEDLVEEIVGEIHDEYDLHEQEIEVIKEDEYIVEGSTKIDLVNEMLGINIESEEFDSIGGFVVGELGRMAEVGDTVSYQSITFEVEEIDKNRIERLRVKT